MLLLGQGRRSHTDLTSLAVQVFENNYWVYLVMWHVKALALCSVELVAGGWDKVIYGDYIVVKALLSHTFFFPQRLDCPGFWFYCGCVCGIHVCGSLLMLDFWSL